MTRLALADNVQLGEAACEESLETVLQGNRDGGHVQPGAGQVPVQRLGGLLQKVATNDLDSDSTFVHGFVRQAKVAICRAVNVDARTKHFLESSLTLQQIVAQMCGLHDLKPTGSLWVGTCIVMVD